MGMIKVLTSCEVVYLVIRVKQDAHRKVMGYANRANFSTGVLGVNG